MIFGKKQTLVMIKRVEFGIYLAETMKDTENNRLLFDNLESQWGAILSAVSSKLDAAEM